MEELCIKTAGKDAELTILCLEGWLDVTFLARDGSFRLSRGNKGNLSSYIPFVVVVDELSMTVRLQIAELCAGTLFVLVKDVPPKQQLLEAAARGRFAFLLHMAICMYAVTDQNVWDTDSPYVKAPALAFYKI